jgi:diguanylate cyclase (GGDEF)-like protein
VGFCLRPFRSKRGEGEPCDEEVHEGMSAVPTDTSLVAEPGSGRDGALPRNARIYFIAVAITAAGVTLPFIGRLQTTHQWPAFLILASAAATARLFVVRTPADQAYHTDIVFLIPAALILPPELLVLVAVVQMVPEWLKMRYRWYLQTFNILDYSLSAMAAWFVGRWLILEHAGIGNDALRLSMAGLAACIVFVAVNHVLLAVMLRLARGFTLRETGLFDAEYVATDLVLAALGVAVYAFWETNPWLVPFALTPLFLIHRSLSVPALQAEARVDPKTGLFNARHFAAALSEEIGRARRFERPMSLIMADLDLLRDINNTYGHLAGDAVLKGIAEVFRAQLRHYDVPARFGGEEFSILLPETPPDQALEIAERIRRAVAARTFERADPRDRLDRRRRLPEGRHGRERAHPPGRPRGLSRQAAGAKPRPRRELGAAARSRRPLHAPDRGPRGRRPSRSAASGHPGAAPRRTS